MDLEVDDVFYLVRKEEYTGAFDPREETPYIVLNTYVDPPRILITVAPLDNLSRDFMLDRITLKWYNVVREEVYNSELYKTIYRS